MVFITIESYENAGVHVIKDNEDYFWVKMKDVQDGLSLKAIRCLIRQQMQGIFETKKRTEEQKKMCRIIKLKKIIIKLKNNDPHYKYARNDIMESVIKNCRGVK